MAGRHTEQLQGAINAHLQTIEENLESSWDHFKNCLAAMQGGLARLNCEAPAWLTVDGLLSGKVPARGTLAACALAFLGVLLLTSTPGVGPSAATAAAAMSSMLLGDALVAAAAQERARPHHQRRSG